MNTNRKLNIWKNAFNPLAQFRREFDQLFDDFWIPVGQREILNSSDSGMERILTPACDIFEGEDHFVVSVDLPGIPKEDIAVEFSENEIRIAAVRQAQKKTSAEGRNYQERSYGRYERSFTLPPGVQSDKIEANYQDGVLRLYLPKAESTKPRQIKIGSGNTPGIFSRLLGQKTKEPEETQPNHQAKSNQVA